MANVFIDIAAEFTGAKSFKKAESATDSLTKNVKKLAKTIGVAYSGAQVLAFAKSSVKAAAADQKAQQQLALALKNVGLERDAASSEAYIQALQSEFGIVDDKLRPAYQTLAVATRDTAQAQKLLNLSLDISASTGKDLGSVTAALSRAYLGNNTSLSKLGVGISKADLKAKSFEEIASQLATTFAGSATKSANTFQGSLDKLGVASANVQEIIGTGLIDAIKAVGDEDGINNLAAAMESAALSAADFLRGLGQIAAFKANGETKSLLGLITTPFKRSISAGPLGAITRIGETSRLGAGGGFPQGAPKEYQSGINTRAAAEALAREEKARKAAAAAAAAQLKASKALIKSQQDALKLSKARAVFDLQKIQIEAALKGKISKEDEIRLKLMQAIEEENLTNVEKYQKALAVAQTKTKELTDLLATVKTLELKDPFGEWKIDPLTASINELTKSMFSVNTQIQANGREWSSFATLVASTVIRPNLSEWNSAFGAATAAANSAASALGAVGTGGTTVGGTTTGGTTTGGTTTGGTTTGTLGGSTTNALIAKAEADAAAAKAAAEAQAAKIAELEATAKAAALLAQQANEYAQRNAAMQAAAAQAALEAAQKALEEANARANQAAADLAAAQTTASNNVNITVNTGIGDPNAIAEQIQQIIEEATQRGTIDFLGIA